MRGKDSKRCRLVNIDGVGVDLNRFHPVSSTEKEQMRKDFGYATRDFILLYIAEFIPRKNHAFLLEQIPLLKQSIPHLKVIFAGKGELLDECKKKAELTNMAEMVTFLGYRNDVDKLCQIADIHVAPSRQEGLPLSTLEAMASGLPIVCSKIRGHSDVVVNERNGLLFERHDPPRMVNAIITLYQNPVLRQEIARNNVEDAHKFKLDTAVEKMGTIYNNVMYSNSIFEKK